MAYTRIYPTSINTNISTKETSMDFTKLVNDYNNGLIDATWGKLTGYSLLVSNVLQDKTVNCVVSFVGQSYNREYTSKYVDTDSRSIYQDVYRNITAQEFITYLKANSNKASCKIVSGDINFSSPITFNIQLKTIAVADKTDFLIIGNEIDKPISLQASSNRCYFELQRKNTSGVWEKVFSKASNTNTVVIPSGTILDLNTEYRVKCSAGLVLECAGEVECDITGTPVFKPLTGLQVAKPTLSNFNYVGEYWEKPITFNWISTNQEGYEYELYSNNVLVKSGTGGTENSFQVPGHTFTSSINPTIRIRNYRTYAGVKYYSNWVEKSLSLKDITATISSLLIEGDFWEKPVKVTWQSSNQQQFKIEVFKSNAIVKTYTGTTATSYTIPAEALTEGAHTIKVTVAYANRYVNSTERTVTLKNIIPTISNLVLSGSNIDLALVLSWTSTDQQKLEVDILKNDLSVKTYTGTVANLVNIPNNTLTTGLHKFRVRVAYKDRWSEWKEITSNLTETLPSIGILEPDGIITKRDEATIIRWDSQNQSKWKLVIDSIHEYTGTNEKILALEPGKLQTGQHSMVLTVWYVTGLGVEKPPVTKKAEWIVQGVPPTPTITSADMFNTNRPITTWDTQDQQGYVLEALKGTDVIYSTDWQNGLIVQHKINDYLENGTYTIRVKVMNKYELESDWGTKQITINAIEDTDITLKSIVIGNNVQLTWDNLGDKFVKFYIIRNNTVIAKTTGTTYTDYTAHRDCIYTVRGITAGDIYKDSNRVYEQVEIDRSILATVEQPQDQLRCAFFTDTDKFNATLGLECKLVEASGREYPIAVFGEHSSKAISLKLLQCDSLDRLIEMFNRRQVFCYRDGTEKVYFIIQSLPYNRDSLLRDHEGTINATVVDYKESVEYD